MNLKERARQIKRDIPAVYLCLKSRDTPWPAKVLAGLTVAYALSPVDLIPDFIPVLGYLDDLILLPGLVLLTLRLTPPSVMEACRAEAEGLWENGRPKKWYYALPVALIWALAAGWVIRAVIRAFGR